MRHQMETRHRNTTFMQCLQKITRAIKTIEAEKGLLLQYSDFNLNDAYKILALQKNKAGDYTQPSKQRLSDLELNAALLALPGQVIAGDTSGCALFCRTYAKDKFTKQIDFEDFIKAFLPCDLVKAKALLQRPSKITKQSTQMVGRQQKIPTMDEIFKHQTFS